MARRPGKRASAHGFSSSRRRDIRGAVHVRRTLVRSLAVCIALATASAHADADAGPAAGPQAGPQVGGDEPKVVWGVVAGMATALVPLAVGGAFFAGTDDTTKRRDAIVGMLSGLALAPIVSHLVAKEWARAGIFGAIPVACVVGMSVLLEIHPSANLFAQPADRLSFGLLISLATLSSGIGLLDTLGAVRRADQKKRARSPVLPVPFATARGGGLVAGGTF